ncbi:MAG: YncE family protein [Gammaproteobacteria bacterium]|nr:YncE family protein [Gammaproteobacteria bacterium]
MSEPITMGGARIPRLSARGVLWALAAVTLATAPGVRAAAAPPAAGLPLRIERSLPIAVPGRPTALAIAPDGGRAYLGVGDTLAAFSTADVSAAGTLPLGGEAVGLQIAPDGRQAYVALAKPARVLAVGLAPLGVQARWKLPAAASGLSLDPDEGLLFVASAATHRLFALDAATGRLRATIALADPPGQMAANGYGSLFVAQAAQGRIAVIDTHTLRLAGTLPLEGCVQPSGLALDPVGRRLFVHCASGAVLVVDTDVGFTFERLPAAGGAMTGLFVHAPLPGWKGAALFVGSAGTLDAVRMLAFIRYVDGGHRTLDRPVAASAYDAVHRRLWIASPPEKGASAGRWTWIGAQAPALEGETP